MSKTLYERLGGEEGLSALVAEVIALHMVNPEIKARFKDTDPKVLHKPVFEFFSAGSGGPHTYSGEDMQTVHRTMNISGEEFTAVVDDVIKALNKHNIDQVTANEVVGIFYSLKKDTIRQ